MAIAFGLALADRNPSALAKRRSVAQELNSPAGALLSASRLTVGNNVVETKLEYLILSHLPADPHCHHRSSTARRQ